MTHTTRLRLIAMMCANSVYKNIKKEKTIMTYQALMLAIARLIVQRAEAHGNTAEQERINAKLDRLYALKATMLEQGAAL